MAAQSTSHVPAIRTQERKEVALQGALQVLAPGSAVDRPDTPDGVVTAVRRIPATPATFAPFPDGLDPRLRAGAGLARRHAALHPSGRGLRARRRRPQHRRHHADGVGQDAVLQPAGARRGAEEPRDARALPVSDQGAGAGSDGGAARARRQDQRGRRRRHRRAHLRRRHAAGRAPHHPHARARRAQQSRHAARGHPAAPSEVGEAVREPALHHHRRAARLSRRVRQPPGQRAAPAAARVPPLRIGSAVHLLVGDHRQPRGAGGAAGRASVHADREERRAARREVLRLRQPADRQPRAGHSALVPERIAPRGGRVPAPQPAGDPVRAEPPRDRDSHDLPEGRFRGRAGHAREDPRLSRRLPAAAPARDREGAARRAGARCRLDQRARARHRHRRAGRVDHGRLSRARLPPPGSGRGGPAGAPRDRRR